MNDAADYKLIKQRNVEKQLDVSRSTLIRMFKRGEFPQPRKVGSNNYWLERDVKDWIAAKFAAPPVTRRAGPGRPRKAAQQAEGSAA